MTSIRFFHLPLQTKIPEIVSKDPPMLRAWNAIKEWHEKIVGISGEQTVLASHACFIMLASKFLNLRAQQLVKKGSATKLQGGLIIKKMQEVSAELRKLQTVTAWLGQRSSLQASVDVGSSLYNALHQNRGQLLEEAGLLPVQRVWSIISLVIEIAPEPRIVKSSDVNVKLAWLQSRLDQSLKRPHDQEEVRDEESNKVDAADADAIRRIQVVDPHDIEVIKRYDIDIGIVPISGPVKNRSVVTAYDLLTLAHMQSVNDAVIDAYLTLVCHTFNGLFQDGVELPQSPRYHAWSAQMSVYLGDRVHSFEERHLRQEWPPARFPHAALQYVTCHIFPIYVGDKTKGHWILMVLQKAEDGQWTLFCFPSAPGYDREFHKPWRVISSWLLFKSKGTFDMTHPRVNIPNPQPTQNNCMDCGVFVCGIVRWSLEGWALSTLTPSVIPEYRRRMILELEKWNLSINEC